MSDDNDYDPNDELAPEWLSAGQYVKSSLPESMHLKQKLNKSTTST